MNAPELLKRPGRRLYDLLTRRLVYKVAQEVRSTIDLPASASSKLAQRVLAVQHERAPLSPGWSDTAGFRAYSQADEDGILLCLFSVLGTTDRRCVEIGGLNPVGANTTNLLVNWGWSGLIIEGDPARAQQIRDWFALHPDTSARPPTVVSSWITSENIDDVLIGAGWSGEIDLLSLDIDGIDYWVWEALGAVKPRVVVCECNAWIPDDLSISVPNDLAFTSQREHTAYFGASLRAMAALGARKGYRFVACSQLGVNLIFVRQDVAADLIPAVPVDHVVSVDRGLVDMFGDWEDVAMLPWVEVER